MEDTTQTSTRKASFLLNLPPRMRLRFPLAKPLLTLPIEVRLGVELCQHVLRILRRFMTQIHLQEVGGGVDVRLGVLVALGDRLPIRATRFEYNYYRGHRSSASVVLWRRRKFVCQWWCLIPCRRTLPDSTAPSLVDLWEGFFPLASAERVRVIGEWTSSP